MLFRNLLRQLSDIIFFILIAMLLAFQYSQVFGTPASLNLKPEVEEKNCAPNLVSQV